MLQPQHTSFPLFSSYTSPQSHAHGMDVPDYNYQLSSLSRVDTIQHGQTLNPTDHSFHIGQAPIAPTSIPYNYKHSIPRTFPMMDDMSVAHDMAAQQDAANHYQPDLQGPLVGNKRSSHTITEEYAKADSIYVAKTAALPATYSHYRPVIGDGNCGWRAIAFCYFEVLQQLGDSLKIEDELGRMMSMGSFIQNATGYDSMIYEDMQQAVLDLLQELIDTASQPQEDVDSVVLKTLNDEEISNSIVYFMRLLASSWMETYPQDYAPFIEGMTIDMYRKSTIEPVNCEIEHVGMKILVDVLLKPIGISVEVVYLDRSPGSQVNTVPMQATDGVGNPLLVGSPTAYLLYRPGHYDILYKQQASAEILPDVARPQAANLNQIEIRQVSSVGNQDSRWTSTPNFGGGGGFDLGILSSIPGMSFAGPQADFGDYDSMSGFKPSMYDMPCRPILTEISHRPSMSSSSGRSSSSILPSYISELSPDPHHMAQPHPVVLSTILPKPLPVASSPSIPSTSIGFVPSASTFLPMTQLQSPINQIRRSRYEVEREFEHPPPPPVQTTTFKNSHYNVAHFNNPDFQPEEWRPDDE